MTPMNKIPKTLQRLGRIAGIAIALTSIGKCVNDANSSTKQVIKPMTEEKKIEIAAEQLAFIKCKQQEGRLTKKNEDEALEIIRAWRLNPEVMQAPKTHARAEQLIAEYRVCELYENVSSVGDLRIKTDEQAKQQITDLSKGQLQYIDILSLAVCMQKQGGWDIATRDKEVEEKIFVLLEENVITEQDLIDIPKQRAGLMAWSMDRRLPRKNCTQSSAWLKLLKEAGKEA